MLSPILCDVPYYKISHSKGISKQNKSFIPFLYEGTYFKCIKMRYITAMDAVGTMLPNKIISKTCLKINIDKEFIFMVQLPKKLRKQEAHISSLLLKGFESTDSHIFMSGVD